MKIEKIEVTIFNTPSKKMNDTDGHTHPGPEHDTEQAMLTITSDDGHSDQRGISAVRACLSSQGQRTSGPSSLPGRTTRTGVDQRIERERRRSDAGDGPVRPGARWLEKGEARRGARRT